LLAPYSPAPLRVAAAAPSAGHWFSTDDLGRDTPAHLPSRWTLCVTHSRSPSSPRRSRRWSARSLVSGGWTDVILMRITDIFLAF
jgi:peptide/nickel transport system permease protein